MIIAIECLQETPSSIHISKNWKRRTNLFQKTSRSRRIQPPWDWHTDKWIHFLITQRACQKYLIMHPKAVTNLMNRKRNRNLMTLGVPSRGLSEQIAPSEASAIWRLMEVKHNPSIQMWKRVTVTLEAVQYQCSLDSRRFHRYLCLLKRVTRRRVIAPTWPLSTQQKNNSHSSIN